MSYIVCIDPGHGGKDRWNVGPTGYVEADGTLDIALNVRDFLTASGVQVILTRVTDTNLHWENDTMRDLRSRANYANITNADYFISIHTNAAGVPEPNGTETYCLIKGGNGEKLAQAIQEAVVDLLNTKSRGVKEGNFTVLRETEMPAVLVEVAFHTNPYEEALLKTVEFRRKSGFAIAKGIANFLGVNLKESANQNEPRFIDIKGHPFEEESTELGKLGIVKGFPDNTARLDNNVTRGEVIAWMWRLYKTINKTL